MALAKTYIQSMKGGAIKELLAHFDIYTGNVPFKNDYKAKQIPKNSWYDEDGDDEYVPDELKMEGYEMTFEIGYKGAYKSAGSVRDRLVSELTKLGEFKIYCDYNDEGRTHVRFVSLSKPTLDVSDDDGDIYKWNLTLKVNDPITSWKPTGNVAMDIILDPSELTFTSLGGTKDVAISVWKHNFDTGFDTYQTPLQSGYTISSASPFTATKKDGALSVTAARYTSAASRSADIEITIGELKKTLRVQQSGRIIVG